MYIDRTFIGPKIMVAHHMKTEIGLLMKKRCSFTCDS